MNNSFFIPCGPPASSEQRFAKQTKTIAQPVGISKKPQLEIRNNETLKKSSLAPCHKAANQLTPRKSLS